MKKKIILFSSIGIVVIAIIIGIIILINPPKKLNQPIVSLKDNVAHWEQVENAGKYEINVDGILYFLDSNVTFYELTDGQEFSVRAISDRKKYTDSDWSTSVTYVTSKTYTVIWKNGDIVIEVDENVENDAISSYDGPVPTKNSTAEYTYTFNGWTKEIDSITNSITYQAKFTEDKRKYTVTFVSDDGITILDTVIVEYGTSAQYSKTTPVKDSSTEDVYVFEKWVTIQGGNVEADLTNVIEDRIVYASFKKFIRTVSVYIVPNNLDYGKVSVSTLNNVPYGTTIIVNENSITINGVNIFAQENPATAQYTYKFINWTVDNTVGNDTIIVANFSRTVNTYTVTWKNGDTILEVDENVLYGMTPVYNGNEPKKNSNNENIYIFNGWTPAISSVTSDITYVAEFTSVVNKHIVIFYDDDGITELGRTVVDNGEEALYPNSMPTKESTEQNTYVFEKWVTTLNGDIDANLSNITEDKVFYAKYSMNVRTYLVSFYDFDGTIISQSEVEYGNAAVAPDTPEREGYRFERWDTDYSNITKEVIVKAIYIQQFIVEFLDYDNSILCIQYVDCNGNAIAPENPIRNNYRFVGWNIEFNNVVEDLTIKAEYIRQYKVIFLDYDGTIIKCEIVDKGASAIAPSNPTKEGYTFDGWDNEFTNIMSDINVTAMYKVKIYTVKFVMPDGTALSRNYCSKCDKYYSNIEIIEEKCPICSATINKVEEQNVEHGFSAIAPEYSEIYLKGTGDYTEVYGFTGWNKEFNSVTENLVIEAVYESNYTMPIIIIEFNKEDNENVKLYVYNSKFTILNAIEFSINYKVVVGNISISSVDVNPASCLWVEDSDGNNDNQYVINNNENTFTFAWSDGNGKQFDWCDKVLTFNFSTSGPVVIEEIFSVIACSAIIGNEANNNFVKITPMVVYR